MVKFSLKMARFTEWVAASAFLAGLCPAFGVPDSGLNVAFPPAKTNLFQSVVAEWAPTDVSGLPGWALTVGGRGGVHRFDQPGGAYQGPAIHAGALVFVTQGALDAKLDGPKSCLQESLFDVGLSLQSRDTAPYRTQGAIVWFMEPSHQPFDIHADTRFAFRADPAHAMVSGCSWKFAWLIVDRDGAPFVSSETFEHTAQSSVQTSGALAALRWARANFSSPNLVQQKLDFNGSQPTLSGLRGAGVYGEFELAEIDAAKSLKPFVWVNLKRFVAGDAATLATALAAYSGDRPPAEPAKSEAKAAPAPQAPKAVQAVQAQGGAADATFSDAVTPDSPSGGGLVFGGVILAVGLGILGFAIWGAAHMRFGGPDGGTGGQAG